MSDELTALQQWRMEIGSTVTVTKGKVDDIIEEQKSIKNSIKSLKDSIEEYNKNVEERFDIAGELALKAGRRGWAAVGISFTVMAVVLIIHFGLTVGGVMSGVGGIAGTIASLKKLI